MGESEGWREDVLLVVPEGARALLERFGKERKVRAGELLFRLGQEGRTLFLVREGLLSVSRSLDEDRKEILGWAQPGEIVGELEFLAGGSRSTTAEALRDSTVVEVGEEVLASLEREAPSQWLELLDVIARMLSDRLRRVNDTHKREILHGIEMSGARALDLRHILRDGFHVEVTLVGGESFAGSIVLISRSQEGYQMALLEDGGELVCIPYGSMANIRALR
jgi:CRP-like cAMP-binding protein